MIYLGKNTNDYEETVFYFYNTENNFIYTVPYDYLYGLLNTKNYIILYKWKHSINSRVEKFSEHDYQIPFKDYVNSGAVISFNSGIGNYHVFDKIIDMLIFESI